MSLRNYPGPVGEMAHFEHFHISTYLLDRSVHDGVVQRNWQNSVENVRQTNIPDFVLASVVFNNQLSFITNTADLNDEIIQF